MLDQFAPYIQELKLLPSGGGRFEVTVDGELIYSKLATGRHAAAGEIVALFQAKTGFEPIPRD